MSELDIHSLPFVSMEAFDGFAKEALTGSNNKIYCAKDAEVVNSKLYVSGNNNVIAIDNGAKLLGQTIKIESSNSIIRIGRYSRITGRIHVKNASSIFIGNKTSFENVALLAAEGKNIVIGDDCMLSFDIFIRTTDAHTIIDINKKERVNPPGDVVIGDHVWIGAGVWINKGVQIASDCIIGMKALVTRSCNESNCALGGVPAKIIKKGITWDRKLWPLE